MGDYYIGAIKEDTRSLAYGSRESLLHPSSRAQLFLRFLKQANTSKTTLGLSIEILENKMETTVVYWGYKLGS